MSRRAPLSRDEKAQLERLAEAGLRAGQIALRLGCSDKLVHYHMTMLGFVPARDRCCIQYERHGRVVRGFTPAEDAHMIALRTAGHKHGAIGRMMGETFGYPRAANTVRCRLAGLAARDEADAR